MHPPPRQGSRTDRRELLAVQSRALITVTEKKSGQEWGACGALGERRGGARSSGQHVPEAAAAQRGPARRQAGAVTRVVPPPLLHHVHCGHRAAGEAQNIGTEHRHSHNTENQRWPGPRGSFAGRSSSPQLQAHLAGAAQPA